MSAHAPVGTQVQVRRFADLEAIAGAVGEEVGRSPWLEITQDRINAFAEATGDHQWIHVDPERAKAGPFGATIAHGYLTLSLLPMLGSQVYAVDSGITRVNYGVERARFPHPVRVGSSVRAVVSFVAAETTTSGVRLVQRFVVEIADAEKPACVADTVVLLRR